MDTIMASDAGSPEWSFERYRAYLYVLARRSLPALLHGKTSASDLVQETLLKADQHRDQFRGQTEEERKVYLRQILKRTVIDACCYWTRKKRDVRLEKSIGQVIEQSAVLLDKVLEASLTGPSTNAERNEALLRMTQELLRLPESQRTALELRYLHNPPYSLAQIAATLQRTEKAAANLLARGLATLRKLMESSTAEVDKT